MPVNPQKWLRLHAKEHFGREPGVGATKSNESSTCRNTSPSTTRNATVEGEWSPQTAGARPRRGRDYARHLLLCRFGLRCWNSTATSGTSGSRVIFKVNCLSFLVHGRMAVSSLRLHSDGRAVRWLFIPVAAWPQGPARAPLPSVCQSVTLITLLARFPGCFTGGVGDNAGSM
jgi:hypothetical protein